MTKVQLNREIIIGDVHGCIDELRELLARISPTSGDKLIFLGDLIDKGPEGVEVLQVVSDLRSRCLVCVIEGNHEEKYKRWHSHKSNGRKQAIESMHGIEDFEKISALVDDDAHDLLLRSPLWVPLQTKKGIAIHGGILPSARQLPSQFAEVQNLTRIEKRLRSKMQRLRVVDSGGRYVPNSSFDDQGIPWWKFYDGRFGEVYFGHTAFLDRETPFRANGCIGMDLGCVYGGHLGAAILSEDVKHETALAVRAKSNYWG